MSQGRIDIVHPLPPPLAGPRRRLACMLGSFDPPHRGHQRLVTKLLERCDAVLLLAPVQHFDKRVVPGENASYEQRAEMLWAVCESNSTDGRVGVGTTEVVLFLELGRALEARFPGTEVVFGMGNDTFGRVADSASYYARRGLPFGAEQAQALEQLLSRILVFGRSAQAPGDIVVEQDVRGISSTLVRARTRQLWQRHADDDAWHAALDTLVSPAVVSLIRSHGLYAGAEGRLG